MNIKIWQITFVNIRISFSPKNYRKWSKNSFIAIWKSNNADSKLRRFFHIFPFIFGFSQMIWFRYNSHSVSIIFAKNLPGFSFLKQDITWETFDKLKDKILSLDKIKKIDIYPDSIFLLPEDNSEKLAIGVFFQKKLNAKLSENKSLPHAQSISKHFANVSGKNWFYLPFKKVNSFLPLKQNSFFPLVNQLMQGKFYYNLDEIPLKTENLTYLDFQEIGLEVDLCSNNHINSLKTSSANQQRNSNKRFARKDYSNNKKITSLHAKKIGGQKLSAILEKTRRHNNAQIIPLTFFISEEKEKKFYNEIKKIFYIDGVIPPNNLESIVFNKELLAKNNSLFLNDFIYSDYCTYDLLGVLEEIIQTDKNIDIFPRVFSGYKYPDMAIDKVVSLGLNYYFRGGSFPIPMKVKIPFASKFFFKNQNLLPSIFSNQRIISDRKDCFFSLDAENIIPNKKTPAWDDALLVKILKDIKIDSKEFDDLDLDGWFLLLQGKNENEILYKLEENNLFEYFLVNRKKENLNKNEVLAIALRGKGGLSPLDLKTFPRNKIKVNIFPSVETFLPNVLNSKLFFANSYKRVPTFSKSIFNTSGKLRSSNFNYLSFFECWEPISLNSWMMVSQFSIGLFILKILKDLYKDYGTELLYYVLQFAASLGIDVKEIKEQFLSDDTDKGFRLIRKVKKGFKDIAGIDGILPQVSEIVWFLRNSGRSSKYKNSMPKGILLVGPPGTGKTLLVQAIAGESEVPVLVESGSSLTDPQQKGKGIQRLKNLFDEARQVSPCIVFIDEIDTLGERRQQITQTAMENDGLMGSLYEFNKTPSMSDFIPKPLNLDEDFDKNQDLDFEYYRSNEQGQSTAGILGKIQHRLEAKKTRLSLLMQFLVEMDGLKGLNGVVVIGATNRPNVLDPALIRPGRFDQTLTLELPGKEKRIEILKLYSEKLTIEKNISWEYLANRTLGFSAADLAAAMNESAIQAIFRKSIHTVESIEKGIDLVTSYTHEAFNSRLCKKSKDPFLISRLAFYQGGKAIIHSLLPDHPPAVVFHLWPRPKNARHKKFQINQKFELKNKSQLENQVIGFYAGKAAELLLLYGNEKTFSLKYWQSNYGIEDLNAASSLVHSMIDTWYLYSRKLINRKFHSLITERNSEEYRNIENIDLINLLETELEDEVEVTKISKLCRSDRAQQQGFGPWWQIQVARQVSEMESFYAEWYRIYLPDPEESILNIDWIPPDEYFHTNTLLKALSNKSDITFNDLYKVEKDYIYHSLILNAFNRSFLILEENREFLDYFADYLIRNKILRQDKIEFFMGRKTNKGILKTSKALPKAQKLKIVDHSWGGESRRAYSRFINLQLLKPLLNINVPYQSPFLTYFKSTKDLK